MTFIWHDVAPPLRRYINFFYAAQGAMPYGRDRILPTASTDLKLNFGDPWRVTEPLKDHAVSICRESWCIGIWNQRHIVEWPQNTEFIGVSFKPGGAYTFLRTPLSELHNTIAPLDAIWGHAAVELRQRLQDARSPKQRFAVLERFLIAQIERAVEPADLAVEVANAIAKRHGSVTIGELCKTYGVSRKHLVTLFSRRVGCTPKELARLCRFQKMLERIDLDRPVRWTSLAHDSDYFDQSHFNRDFEAFVGLTPTAYLAQRRTIHAESPEHADVRWVLPTG